MNSEKEMCTIKSSKMALLFEMDVEKSLCLI